MEKHMKSRHYSDVSNDHCTVHIELSFEKGNIDKQQMKEVQSERRMNKFQVLDQKQNITNLFPTNSMKLSVHIYIIWINKDFLKLLPARLDIWIIYRQPKIISPATPTERRAGFLLGHPVRVAFS